MSTLKTIHATVLATTLACVTGAGLAVAADQSSSMKEAVSDTWITTKVKAELVAADKVSSTDISVTTIDGVVTLTGVLPDKAELDRVVALTRGIDGVKDIDSAGLKIGDAASLNGNTADDDKRSAGEVVDDTWITTKLKADLATTKGVPSRNIKVRTENGTVTLTGALPDQLAVDKAVATARAIKGVKHVDADALVVEGK